MFSEALRILDQNTMKYMIDEMKQEIDEQKAIINEKDAEIAALKKLLEDTKK